MAFGGEVDDGSRPVFGQKAVDQGTVADIALHKQVVRVALYAGERLQVARIGELVQIDHRVLACGQPVEHKIAADETGAAGHEDCHENVPESFRTRF